MTDTMTTNLSPMAASAYEEYKKRAAIVAELDEQLNVDGGAGALAKQAVANLPEADDVTSQVTRLVMDRAGADLLAVTTLIRRVLRSVEGQVKEYVDANKVESAPLDPAVETQLRKDRKAAVDAANMLRTMLETLDPAWAAESMDAIMPKLENKRGAAPGTRSPRLKGSFNFTVDGAFVSTKLQEVADHIGIPNKDLKAAMVQAYADRGVEFNFAEPPERIEFTYTHGEGEKAVPYKVIGTQSASDSDSGDDEDDAYDEPDTGTDVDTDDDEDPFA